MPMCRVTYRSHHLLRAKAVIGLVPTGSYISNSTRGRACGVPASTAQTVSTHITLPSA